MSEAKRCSKCDETKARSEFHKSRAERDGLQYYCRVCAKVYVAKYARANPEKCRAYVAKYSRANPDKMRAKHQRRRARLADADGDHTAADLHILWTGACFYCAKPLRNWRRGHVEHKTPLSRGGCNNPSNLCWACPPCNLRKGAMTAPEYLERIEREKEHEHADERRREHTG